MFIEPKRNERRASQWRPFESFGETCGAYFLRFFAALRLVAFLAVFFFAAFLTVFFAAVFFFAALRFFAGIDPPPPFGRSALLHYGARIVATITIETSRFKRSGIFFDERRYSDRAMRPIVSNGWSALCRTIRSDRVVVTKTSRTAASTRDHNSCNPQ